MAVPWPTLAIILAVGLGLQVLVRGVFAIFPRVTRLVERSFWCPFRDVNVTAEFQRDPWNDNPLSVDRCSAFTPPTAITCDRRCVRLAKLPAAQHEARVA